MSTATDTKQMPRFGSLSSPSTYRPSYSGGTYRSVGIKREPPINSSYTSRWLASGKESTSTKESSTVKKPTKTSSNTDSTSTSDAKSISNGHIPSVGIKSKIKEQTTRPTITVAKVRIRDQSSSTSSYSTSKSREPSPSEPIKDRYTSSSGYVSSSYSKLYPRNSNKLQINSYRTLGTSNPAISYMNGSEVSARCRKNAEKVKDKQKEKSPKSSSESSSNKESTTVAVVSTTTTTTTTTVTTPPATSSDSTEIPDVQTRDEMVEVTVVTRGTSPNLCSTTNFSRCRRADLAKTIEKVIYRPKRKAICEDKEVQSDRMDDTSKYCRFNATRSSTPWPSYLESKYNPISYSRYGNNVTPSKYTPLNKSDKESNESSSEKIVEKSPSKSRESSVSKSPSVSRSGSIRSSSKSDKSKSRSPPITSHKSTSTSPSKQKSSNKALPPPAPKTETSPIKVILDQRTADETKSDRNGKWANKDFRKSALNVGPSDRPRKSRNSSVDNEPNDQQKSSHTERSSSVSSETSHSSNGGNTDDLTKNLLKLKISQSTPTTTTTSNQQQQIVVNDVMHLNTDSLAHESKSSSNEKLSPQSLQQQIRNKIDNNTKSSMVARSLDAVVKMFKSKSIENRLIEAQNVSDNESAVSINESTKQDTFNETVLNRTTITNNLSKTVNSNSYLADESSWMNTTQNDQTTDNPPFERNYQNAANMKNQLRHIDSNGQLPWWMTETENDDTMAEDITLNQSDNEVTFNKQPNQFQLDNLDEVDTSQTERSVPWWMSDENNSRSDGQKYRITHIRSGERAWWLDEDTEESVNDILEAAETSNDAGGSRYTFKIKKIESGERAWWLCEDNDSTNINDKTDFTENQNDEAADVDFWAAINESLEAKNKNDTKSNGNERYALDMNANYISLGARASPEGLEDFNNSKEMRLSPYDNLETGKMEQNFTKLFISRHQNIDDVLGGPVHVLSPVLFDPCNDANESFEEILPSQVRIHDGTARKTHIQYKDDRFVRMCTLYLPICEK